MAGTLKANILDQNELEMFRTLALRYVEIGANEGIRIIPFASPDLPHFHEATSEQRKKAIECLTTIVNIHEETLAAGERTINSRKLIWRALSKLGLVPGPDIFENFTDEDVVIIYQEDQTIIFWNLVFFRYTSLTVEHMFFTQWYECTKRLPEIQQKLYEMAVEIISGKIKGNFIPPVPAHEVEEINSLECIKTWMELPFGSVLTRNGQMGGILIVQKMKII